MPDTPEAFQAETPVPFRNAGGSPCFTLKHPCSGVEPAGGSLAVIANVSERLASGTSSALDLLARRRRVARRTVSRQAVNTDAEERDTMISRLALAIVLGTVLMTTTAQSVQAARPEDDTQAPRTYGVQALRDRGQDIQAPRGEETQAPRG
jgi:hypothetical protein